MINFFRKIRYNLMEQNKTGKYLKYAIGEILLVVIGILIALSINNWNEDRKKRVIERESYENLATSLKKDSLELVTILSFQNKSMFDQNRFIKSDLSEIKALMTNEEISQSLYNVFEGVNSFFPKYGTYNSILLNEGIDLLKSKEIRSLLIELYDYQCKRYENQDAIIDSKFMYDFIPFVQRNLGFFVDSNFEYKPIDMALFEKDYQELVLQCKNLNTMTRQSIISLIEIQKSVNELISQIEKELEK